MRFSIRQDWPRALASQSSVAFALTALSLFGAPVARAQTVVPSSTGQLPAMAPEASRPPTIADDPIGHVYVDIETSKGMIEAELDFQRAPLTVLNFIGLAEGNAAVSGAARREAVL